MQDEFKVLKKDIWALSKNWLQIFKEQCTAYN